MDLPTVASLCADLPDVLLPAPGFTAPRTAVSAVHVSELIDPTDYLSGGELLLTTGLSLPDNEIAVERYVGRLARAGLSGLGLGLGPSLTTVPPNLAAACAAHGMCLLVVPATAAFLTVSKAYWAARSRSTHQELTDAITAHRSLVDAMVAEKPVVAALRALSRALGAWTATFDAGGTPEQVFPAGRISDAVAVGDQLDELKAAGPHSTATFPRGDEVVAVFPLSLEDRVVGYLAIGSPDRLSPAGRRLVLTATALLSLDSVQQLWSDAAQHARADALVTLIDLGLVDSALRLGSRLGMRLPDPAARVIALRTRRPAEVARALSTTTSSLLALPHGDAVWGLWDGSDLELARLPETVRSVDPGAIAAVSDPVQLDRVHDVRVRLQHRLLSLPAGSVQTPTPRSGPAPAIVDDLQAVLGYERADLTSALVAYLRHRGQWDPAARDLGVHRNTMRHRLDRVRAVMTHDVDDPDVAATLWLHLRANGLA